MSFEILRAKLTDKDKVSEPSFLHSYGPLLQ